MKRLVPENWSEILTPGSRALLGTGAAYPEALVHSMLSQAIHYKDVELLSLLTPGKPPWEVREFDESFLSNRLHRRSGSQREATDFTPLSLFELPQVFACGEIPLSAVLVSVTPADSQGYHSLGPSVDILSGACRAAEVVVAQVNVALPRTVGESFIHETEIDFFIEASAPPHPWNLTPPDEACCTIGQYLAQLIPNGATLHVGVGQIATALVDTLREHKHLGIHTEVLGDALCQGIAAGLFDNTRKGYQEGLSVATSCLGTSIAYSFINDNPHIVLGGAERICNTAEIGRNRQMFSIGSARTVDLLGQAASEAIEEPYFTCLGDQGDFLRGANLSVGGASAIALPSTDAAGRTRIVATISRHASAYNTSSEAHYVVTEYGIATLKGRSLRERALEMIQIAHPDHREALLEEAREQGWIPSYQVNVPQPVTEIDGIEHRTVTLKDGAYLLRPLQLADERRLQEFFYSHSRETIQQRYGFMVSRMTRKRAHDLVGVNQTNDLALGIFETQGPRQVIHAVGRYYLEEEGDSAEMAFVVRESKRRVGMGRLLLNSMLEIARKRGLKRLWALVAAENQAMLGVFRSAGAVIHDSSEPTMREAEILC